MILLLPMIQKTPFEWTPPALANFTLKDKNDATLATTQGAVDNYAVAETDTPAKSTCLAGDPIASNGTCTITATMDAGATASAENKLVITNDDTTNLSEDAKSDNFAIAGTVADIQLAKKGDAGAVTMTAEGGDISLFKGIPTTFTVYNSSTVPVTFNADSFAVPENSGITVINNGCDGPLAIKGQCNVILTADKNITTPVKLTAGATDGAAAPVDVAHNEYNITSTSTITCSTAEASSTITGLDGVKYFVAPNHSYLRDHAADIMDGTAKVCTSKVTAMNGVFEVPDGDTTPEFKGNISNWDTSNVTSMS